MLDNLTRDVLYAWRSFRRAPLVALTIVTTVALGLGLVAVVFTFLNEVIFRVDEVRNPHELFAVERQRSANAEPESFTRSQYDALVRETGVFSDAFAMGPDIDSPDRWPEDGGLARDGELLPRSRRQRRAWTHAHTVRRRASAAIRPIVLSHRAWSRYFASDPGVLGRTVLVNGVAVRRSSA